MRSVNVNNFAHGVASYQCGNTLKVGAFLTGVRSNTPVALHLQPQTCNFPESYVENDWHLHIAITKSVIYPITAQKRCLIRIWCIQLVLEKLKQKWKQCDITFLPMPP